MTPEDRNNIRRMELYHQEIGQDEAFASSRQVIELLDEIAELEAEVEEDAGVIRVWRGRTERAEAERDRLREALKYLLAVSEPFHRPTDSLGWGAVEAARAALRSLR